MSTEPFAEGTRHVNREPSKMWHYFGHSVGIACVLALGVGFFGYACPACIEEHRLAMAEDQAREDAWFARCQAIHNEFDCKQMWRVLPDGTRGAIRLGYER